MEAYAREYPFAHVSDRILQLRADLGWTQQELAERAGTTQSVIARAESGRHSFRIDLLDRIAGAAGVTWWPRFDGAPTTTGEVQTADASFYKGQ
jgi:transcriptional regulator with XRE-family HTH domain